MRCEGRLGHPTAPRGASMLEMEKYGNGAAGAASGNCSDARASKQNARAARVAVAAEWICHRDIVNLKQSVAWHAALQAAPRGADVTTSIRAAAGPCLAGQLPAFRLQSSRADARRVIESGKRSDGSTTRPGLSVQPAGHRVMVPAECLAQPMSEPAARTRSEFVTHHK